MTAESKIDDAAAEGTGKVTEGRSEFIYRFWPGTRLCRPEEWQRLEHPGVSVCECARLEGQIQSLIAIPAIQHVV